MNRYASITSFSDTILMLMFGAVCIGVAFASLLLWFHWSRYSMKDTTTPFAQIIYFLGLFILLLIVLVFLL